MTVIKLKGAHAKFCLCADNHYCYFHSIFELKLGKCGNVALQFNARKCHCMVIGKCINQILPQCISVRI